MSKIEFDVVKPNIHVFEDEIVFGINRSDSLLVGDFIDDIVGKNIGTLKVTRDDLDIAECGKATKSGLVYTVPLREYLDAFFSSRGYIAGITNDSAELFGLTSIIRASTIENPNDFSNLQSLQSDLANPDETFDKKDSEDLVYRIDRVKTLEEMKRLYKELETRVPQNSGYLIAMRGNDHNIVGEVGFNSLRAENRTAIEKAKTDIVEKLKEVRGPCLSFDASGLLSSASSLYDKSTKLIQEYGDILTSPNWQTRFFKLDP